MLLIATDEAGYGPRLGPLVIVATAWQLRHDAPLATAADRLAEPIDLPPLGTIRIDDSKRVFRRHRCSARQLCPLQLITAAAARWAKLPCPLGCRSRWLQHLAGPELQALQQLPWLAGMGQRRPDETPPQPLLLQQLVDHWDAGPLRLVGIAARLLEAGQFNRLVQAYGNKAELLSNETCRLAIGLIERQRQIAADEVLIASDRHGGRAYYGGLLQHQLPDHQMAVVAESARQSEYRLLRPSAAAGGGQQIRWRFTVGGDSQPPVAMSSLIAKATREWLMQQLNDYFAHAWQRLGQPGTLRPTAGYGADANRFLSQVSPLLKPLQITESLLVRSR